MKNTSLFSILILFVIFSCTKNNQITLTPFTDGEKWVFIDSVKKVVLTTVYDDVFPFSEGFAAVKINGKWGFIDKKGEEVIVPIKYDFVGSFHDGYAIVRQYGKWGFINQRGVEVIPPETFDFVGEYSEGLAIFCKDNRYGFIDRKGKIIIDPQYDLVWNFTKGRAKVFQNQRYGFINKRGNEIVPVKYDLIYSYRNGVALAKQNSKWSFINEKGEEIVELFYDYIWDEDASGFLKVFKNNKYGFINNKGEEIILPKYDYAEDFLHDVSIVRQNGLFGLIDRFGKEVVPVAYKSIQTLNQAALQVENESLEVGYMNPYGKEEMNYNGIKDLARIDFPNQSDTAGTYIDKRDNQVYHWVRIGSQIWMTENLKFQTTDSKCHDTQRTTDCELYGRYYPWDTTNDICPEGWKLPSDQDWKLLINELGGDKAAYSKLIEGGESGLNLKFGGYFFNQTTFENVSDYGYFWTSTEDGSNTAICYWLNKDDQSILQFSSKKNHSRNVRCMKK